jgi:hypothetical protein
MLYLDKDLIRRIRRDNPNTSPSAIIEFLLRFFDAQTHEEIRLRLEADSAAGIPPASMDDIGLNFIIGSNLPLRAKTSLYRRWEALCRLGGQ